MASRVLSPRSLREQLQIVVGTRATVLDFVRYTDAGHPYVGWWVSVHVADPDCACDWCASASRGVDHYVGYHFRDALPALADYLRAHPELD